MPAFCHSDCDWQKRAGCGHSLLTNSFTNNFYTSITHHKITNFDDKKCYVVAAYNPRPLSITQLKKMKKIFLLQIKAKYLTVDMISDILEINCHKLYIDADYCHKNGIKLLASIETGLKKCAQLPYFPNFKYVEILIRKGRSLDLSLFYNSRIYNLNLAQKNTTKKSRSLTRRCRKLYTDYPIKIKEMLGVHLPDVLVDLCIEYNE